MYSSSVIGRAVGAAVYKPPSAKWYTVSKAAQIALDIAEKKKATTGESLGNALLVSKKSATLTLPTGKSTTLPTETTESKMPKAPGIYLVRPPAKPPAVPPRKALPIGAGIRPLKTIDKKKARPIGARS